MFQGRVAWTLVARVVYGKIEVHHHPYSLCMHRALILHQARQPRVRPAQRRVGVGDEQVALRTSI